VWFDRYDQGGVSVTHGMPYRRCHFCERAAMEPAINHLASLNHKTIPYAAQCNGHQSWQTR